MAIGRPTKPLNVTPEEKEKLSMLARRPKSAQAMAMRARIVLGCSEGLSNGEVAKRLRITGATVVNGGSGFARTGWKGYWTSLARVRRGRSRTRGSKR
jgi:hypothetical protein